MRVWNAATLAMRIGAAAFAAVVGLIGVVRSSGLFPDFPVTPNLDTAAWIIALVIIGVDNVASLITRSARRRRAVRNAEIEKALMALLVSVAKRGELRFEELGASVFVASRRDRFFRPHKQPKRLIRIVRFRPADYPQQSGVDWSPAKGAVGEAWTKRKTAKRDWNAVARR